MTVVQLKQQIDRRFDEQRVRLDAGFTSLHDKLNAILRTLKSKDDNQQEVLDGESSTGSSLLQTSASAGGRHGDGSTRRRFASPTRGSASADPTSACSGTWRNGRRWQMLCTTRCAGTIASCSAPSSASCSKTAAVDHGITLEEWKRRSHARSERVSRVRGEMRDAGLI